MATLPFDEIELSRKIEQLPAQVRAAFAGACAERLLLAYAKFSARTGKGNPSALREILIRLWNDLAGNPMSDMEVDAEIEACMELIPQEDEGAWVMEQAAAETQHRPWLMRFGVVEAGWRRRLHGQPDARMRPVTTK